MKKSNDAVIVSTLRTPVAKYRGDFATLTMPELGAIVLKGILEKTQMDPAAVDELIFGNLYGSDYGNTARCCWLEAGYPLPTSALTVDRQCGSAVNAVGLAAVQIREGIYDVCIAGGVESYSQQPIYIQRPQRDFPDDLKILPRKVAPEKIGKGCLATDMMETADKLAEMYGISREECDRFALASHLNAAAAWKNGLFDEQVMSVTIPQKKGEPKLVRMDACIRPDSSMETLGKLKALAGGVTTAGNSSPRNDAATALLIMRRDKASALGYTPLAKVREYATAGVDPRIMGIGPVASTRRLMERFGYSLADFKLIELNEAFAAQSLACIKELGLDPSIVNVEGGAIAIGHPTGASGGMLAGRLVHALKHRGEDLGLVTFCCGGGQGISLVIENE